MFSTRIRLVTLFTLLLSTIIFSAVKFGPIQQPETRAEMLAPTITATMTAAPVTDIGSNGAFVNPGDKLQYTVTINNIAAGAGNDATNVIFTDVLNSNLTLEAGSVKASPIAGDDVYAVTGNVRISATAGTLLTNDIRPVTGSNAGLTITKIGSDTTAPFSFTTTNGGTVTATTGDGSFQYDPPVGFEGTGASGDTFTYVITDTDGLTATGTVRLDVSGMIWFIDNSAAACTTIAAGCGRLTTPFSSLSAFSTLNVGGGSNPDINDNIFLYSTGAGYTGGLALLNGQKLIGQGASASLVIIAGITLAPNSDALPLTGGTRPTISNAAGGGIIANAVGGTNTIRGITYGAVGNGNLTKLGGANFGTITIGNNVSPDVQLTGAGRALDFVNGSFAASSGFVDITTTGGGTHGINLSNVGGTVNFGATTVGGAATQGINIAGSSVNATFGTTQISGTTTQGILIGTSTGNITFGNTTVQAGTDGVSLQNNSAGTRTFGTLNISGSSGNGFLHTVGGGNVTVNGAASIVSNNTAVSIQNPSATNVINFAAATSVSANTSGQTGVLWTGVAGASVTFNSLSIATNNGTALNATSGGTFNVTNGTGAINGIPQPNPAIVASGIALNANFSQINSGGGANGVSLTSVTGTSNFGTGFLSNQTGSTFLVNGGTCTVTYNGVMTPNPGTRVVDIQNKTGGTVSFGGAITALGGTNLGILLNSNTGATINFTGGLDLSTGANPAFTATGGGTVNATQNNTSIVNTLTTTTGTALNIQNTTIGGSGLTFRSISSNGAANGINMLNTGAGSFTVTGNGSTCTVATPTCDGGSIQSSTGYGILFNKVGPVSLTRIKVQNSGTKSVGTPTQTAGDTCVGACINGFTMDNSIITDSAGGATDDGLVLTNVTGAVSITNSAIANIPHNGMWADNFSYNMSSFTMTNTTISCASGQPCQPSGSVGNDALLLVMRGTSVLTSGSITSSTFSGVRAVGVQVQTGDTGRIGSNSGGVITAPAASNSITIGGVGVGVGNTFTGNGQGIDVGTAQVSNMSFQILNNSVVGKVTSPGAISNQSSATAINAFTAAGADTGSAHTFVGKIDSNTIGTQGVKDSGAGFGAGIRVVVQGVATQGVVSVTNNTIREVPNSDIMIFFGQNGAASSPSASARFKVQGNTLPAFSGSNLSLCGPANSPCPGNGIFVLADEGSAVCNSITGNTIFDVSPIGGGFDVYLAERAGPPAGAQLTVEGTGSVSAFVQANNTLTGAQKFIDEGANTSLVAPGGCGAFPAIAPPVVETSKLEDRSYDDLSFLNASFETTAETLAGIPKLSGCPIRSEQVPDTNIFIAAAIYKPIVITGEAIIGYAASQPELLAEATYIPNVERAATKQSSVTEIVRKLSSLVSPMVYAQDSEKVDSPQSGETVTVNGGGPGGFIIPAGKSTTITFNATIAKPTVPINTFSISNQGSVAGTGFATVLTNAVNTTIIQAPTISKAFNPTSVNNGAPSTLTFTITNANPTQTASAIAFTDTFPVNLVVANPATASTTCAGATFTNLTNGVIAPSDTGVKLTGGSLAINGATCTATVQVRSTVQGAYPNTTGIISSFEGFTGATSNTATLNVSLLTAAGVSVSGRVTNVEGRGVRNANVVITDSQGVSRRVTTGPNGNYNFDDVEVGQNYIISVVSRRYQFTPRVVNVMDQLTNVDFVAGQ